MPKHSLNVISEDKVTTLENEIIPLKNLRIKSIKSGIDCIVVLINNGLVFGYGNNGNGDIGLGKEIDDAKEFTQIPNLENKIKLMECGYECTFIVDEFNQLYFTGIAKIFSENGERQFTFTKMEKFSENITFIRIAYDVVFIVTENNLLYVRGRNDGGQLGLGHNNPVYNSFVKNSSLQHIKIKDLKCVDYHTIILDDNGIVYFCGKYKYNENNNDNNEDFCFKPLEFVSSKIKSISATSHLSILYSYNNELIILDQYKTPIVYTVLVLPSGMELNSLFSNAYRAEYFTGFVTKENKIYVHKQNYELPYDMDFQVGDYVKLNDSFLGNTLNLPNLKIIGMDYSNMYVIYTDYLISEDIVDDNKNLNLFFGKLYNQLLDSKNSFIDIEFVI